jgi:hypothetical protein
MGFWNSRTWAVFSAVCMLLGLGCPSDIARLIVAIVVDAVERVFSRGTRPYRRQELIEGCEAELDPTAAVISPRSILHIGTPLSGSVKGEILRRTYNIWSVLLNHLHPLLKAEAAAGCAFSVPQTCRSNRFRDSAITATVPESSSVFVAAVVDDYPTAKTLIREVLEICSGHKFQVPFYQ